MKRITLFIFFSCIGFTAFSQDSALVVAPLTNGVFAEETAPSSEYSASVDIDFRAAFTSGEFKQFYPKRGMGGLGLTLLFSINKKIPIDIGFGLGYYWMSRAKETFNYYTPEDGHYDVESRVSGGMIPLHLTTRLYPLKSTNFPIQPYIEGLTGIRVFSANQRLETYLRDIDTYLPVEKDYNLTASWSYGYGGGLKVRLSKKELLFLNMKVTQLYGTSTKTMDPSSVEINDDLTYSFLEIKSRTDILRFSLGINVLIK